MKTPINMLLAVLVAITPVALIFSGPPDNLKAAARKVTTIIAHRGSSSDRPENTLASYRRSIEAGATATEADIRTTRDDMLISLHDADVRRTTNGKGLARELSLAELRQLDAGRWFGEKFAGEKIPTLQEVLETCRGKIDVLLDLQEPGEVYAQRITAEVRKYGEPKRTIVGVRSLEHAQMFRKLLPEARQLGLIPTPESIEPFARAGVETIRLWPKWLKDETLVPRVRKAGCKLHLNGTTGSEDDIRPLLVHEPESLASDDPGQLVQTLTRLGGVKK